MTEPASDQPEGASRSEDLSAGVAAYAAAVASDEPAPGGGSVVSVAAALAAALGSMVCRFSPPSPSGASASLAPVLDELDRLRGEMLDLANADAVAYGGYRTARELPKGTDQERQQRRSAVRAALIEAIEVPLAVARGSRRIHALLGSVVEAGNPHLRSDAEIGRLLAAAAVRGALFNARGNAALLKDEERARHYLDSADSLERGLDGPARSG